MRAVILAAGDGGRLRQHTATLPKPLIPVSGRLLIDYTLEAVDRAGVEDAVVVVGYRAAQVRTALAGRTRPRLTFAENPRFHGAASLSLRAARAAVEGERFLLLMSDHMLSAAVIEPLIREYTPGGPSLIATDASRWPAEYVDEATRVRLTPGSVAVAAIGKHLEPFDALDTGAFLLGPEAWAAIDAAPEECELSVIFSELARRGALHSVDVSGASWYDVDTPDDLEAATRRLAVLSGKDAR